MNNLKKPLISLYDIFGDYSRITSGDYINTTLIKDNSYLSGSSALTSNRIASKSISFSSFISMNLSRYNQVLGLLDQTYYLQYKDEQLDGYQPVRITSMGMDWQEGSFLLGGIFTIELILLKPFFETFDHCSADIMMTLPKDGFQNTSISLDNASAIASSFFIKMEALEPNRFLQIALENKSANLTFTDLNGFGRDYSILVIDSGNHRFNALDKGGLESDVSSYLSKESGFFLLSPGKNSLIIRSTGAIKILALQVRQRWYI